MKDLNMLFQMNLIAWIYLVKLRCYGMIIRLSTFASTRSYSCPIRKPSPRSPELRPTFSFFPWNGGKLIYNFFRQRRPLCAFRHHSGGCGEAPAVLQSQKPRCRCSHWMQNGDIIGMNSGAGNGLVLHGARTKDSIASRSRRSFIRPGGGARPGESRIVYTD